jgi:hypothetical protein
VPRIFINYRREDTSSNASRLYEWLSERYGDDQVFMDVDAIEPGLDWAEAIDRAVGSSDLLLALIGNEWLRELKRRANEQDDFMRHELEAALRRDIRIIPVLVEGAKMPRAEDLPESLAALTRRQAFEVRDERFRFDKQELLKRVDRALGIQPQQQAAPAAEPKPAAAVPTAAPAAETDAAVSEELAKWNWGAFLLGPIWGIGHGVFRSLLTLVPLYGIYEWIMLGRNGNRWAWEARTWDSIESFRKSQRKWAKWGAIIDVLVFLVIVGSNSGSGG